MVKRSRQYIKHNFWSSAKTRLFGLFTSAILIFSSLSGGLLLILTSQKVFAATGSVTQVGSDTFSPDGFVSKYGTGRIGTQDGRYSSVSTQDSEGSDWDVSVNPDHDYEIYSISTTYKDINSNHSFTVSSIAYASQGQLTSDNVTNPYVDPTNNNIATISSMTVYVQSDTTTPANPVATPGSGTVVPGTTVTLSSSDTDGYTPSIYYTTNKYSTPSNTNGTLYNPNTPIAISSPSETINAIAYNPAGVPSGVSTFNYTVGLPSPQLTSPTNGQSFTYAPPNNVSLTWQPGTGTPSTVDSSLDYKVAWSNNQNAVNDTVNGYFDGVAATNEGNAASASINIGNFGTYYWAVEACYQGTCSWSSIDSFTAAYVAPTVTLVSPGASTTSSQPTFTWSGTQGSYPIIKYTFELANNPSFNHPITYTGSATSFTPTNLLNNTTWYWRVKATDLLGTDSAWAEASLDVNAPVPVVTINNSPVLTNSTTPVITGTVSTPSSVVVLSINNVRYDAVVSGTNWTVDVTTPLAANQTYALQATATDLADNIGIVDSTLTIDTVKPTITVESSPNSTGNFSANIFGNVSFALYDPYDITGYWLNNGSFMPLSHNDYSNVNNVSIGSYQGGVAGVNTIYVEDVAGNVSSYTFTLDNTGPTITPVNYTGTLADNIFSKVNFDLYDACDVTGYSFNGGSEDLLSTDEWSNINDVYVGSYHHEVAGTNIVTVYDACGNSTSYTFTLNSTPPTIYVKGDNNSYTPASVGDFSANIYGNVSFKLYDPYDVASYWLNNGSPMPLSPNQWSDINDVSIGGYQGGVAGMNTLYVEDTAGNISSYSFTLDNTGPTITPKDSSAFTVGSIADNIYSKVGFSLYDACEVTGYSFNGGSFEALTPNDYSDVNDVYIGSYHHEVAGLNTLTAYDACGNSSSYTFTLDDTAPSIYVKGDNNSYTPSSVGNFVGNAYSNVSFKLYDPEEVDEVTLNGVVKDLTPDDYSDVNDVTPGVFGAVEGQNTIVVYDLAGNSTIYTFTLDDIAPSTPVPTPAAGTYTTSQQVTLSSTDDIDVSPTIYYTTDGSTPSSTNGSLYIGPINVSSSETIKAIAYDEAGNASGVLSASYTISPVIPTISLIATTNSLTNAVLNTGTGGGNNNTGHVLGDSTTTSNTSSDSGGHVKGDSTNISNVSSHDKNDSKTSSNFLGLGWWWLLVLALIAFAVYGWQSKNKGQES